MMLMWIEILWKSKVAAFSVRNPDCPYSRVHGYVLSCFIVR